MGPAKHGMRCICLAVIGGAVLALAGYALASSSGGLASNSANFTDPAGDSGNAPDVTKVALSNDDAGNITFAITLANRPAFFSGDVFEIYLDTDRNPSTGITGFDYAIGSAPLGSNLFKWNGSTFAPTLASITAVLANGVLTIQLNNSELGGPGAFDFRILVSGDSGETAGEKAPDSGLYTYTLGSGTTASTAAPTFQPPPPRPALQIVKLTVGAPKEGEKFRATIVVRRTDNRSPLSGGTLTCFAEVSGKTLPATDKAAPKNGVATCSWLVPKATRGKTVAGKVSVAFKGARVSRTFSRKIG